MAHSKLSPHVAAVMKLLLEQGVTAAQAYVTNAVGPEVARARDALEARLHEEAVVRNIVALAMQSVANSHTKPASEPVIPIEKAIVDERSNVLRVAAEVASQNQGVANLEAVVKELEKRGLKLRSARPNTSVANILYKASHLWGRTAPGVFLMKGRAPKVDA